MKLRIFSLNDGLLKLLSHMYNPFLFIKNISGIYLFSGKIDSPIILKLESIIIIENCFFVF